MGILLYHIRVERFDELRLVNNFISTSCLGLYHIGICQYQFSSVKSNDEIRIDKNCMNKGVEQRRQSNEK